jgi:predicted DNA-binding WGR domain protein
MTKSIDLKKEPLDKIVLNYFDVRENSNKVWIGEIYADALFVAQWGRVRSEANLQITKLRKLIISQQQPHPYLYHRHR